MFVLSIRLATSFPSFLSLDFVFPFFLSFRSTYKTMTFKTSASSFARQFRSFHHHVIRLVFPLFRLFVVNCFVYFDTLTHTLDSNFDSNSQNIRIHIQKASFYFIFIRLTISFAFYELFLPTFHVCRAFCPLLFFAASILFIYFFFIFLLA